MTSKEFNNIEEIEKYYDEKANAYIFKEDGEYIRTIVFKFDLVVYASIDAWNIRALNIRAWNINAMDIEAKNIDTNGDIDAYDIVAIDVNANNIKANDITARNIRYYAVCYADVNIKCKSIKGRRKNAKHFVLDGELEVKENVD